jgi:hypothetical protein
MSTTAAPPITTLRVLPGEEFPRLADLPFAQAYGVPDPRYAQILVAEDPTGTIVGVWAALNTVHLDGLWIAEDYRKTSRVASQLLRGMKRLLTSLGIVHSFTMISYETPEVLQLSLKAGFQQLPVHLCFLDLTRESPPDAEGAP